MTTKHCRKGRWSLRSTLALLVTLVPAIAFSQIPLAPNTQVPLPAKAIPKFVQALPLLDTQGGPIATSVAASLNVAMCEFPTNILPPGTIAPGVQTSTWTWGYKLNGACPSTATAQQTYIGPVVIAQRNVPTEVTWTNNLPTATTSNVVAWKFGTDPTLHWADPLALGCMDQEMATMTPPAFGTPCAQNYLGPIPAVPHLHGGEVPPGIDGSPDSWFTSDGAYRGVKYYTKAGAAAPANGAFYAYPNTQEAAPLWFHDHTLGVTRLNVFAGLAGAYFITDPALALPPNLQTIPEVIPLVIQDRMFDTTGQLFFPAANWGGVVNALNPQHPFWNPEFIGDTIVVNGKVWPFVNVQPKRYRFLFLNGSNARTYELFLINQKGGGSGPTMWVIGNDGGYLDSPQAVDPKAGGKLLIMPGERYEVIIDFAAFPGTNLLLRNTGRTPYPGGPPPNGTTLGQIVQFRVGPGPVADASYDPALGGAIRGPGQTMTRFVNPLTGTLLAAPTKIRQLTLNEVMGMGGTGFDVYTGAPIVYPGGPLEILLNNTDWNGTHVMNGMVMGRGDFTPITVGGKTVYYSELPQEGDTEQWEIVNLTADAHPIHLHLVQFQLLSRQAFDLKGYSAAYALAFPTGLYTPGYGPPMNYSGAMRGGLPLDGGNPDVTPFLRDGGKPPAAQESGWKDTLVVPPGMVTRFIVRWAPHSLPLATPAAQLAYPFDPNDGGLTNYVWHCHILDHEDNEMMRPTSVTLNPLAPAPAARQLVKGIAY
ncbi:MAG: multicopper oxidase domain-containing protein [Anaeromyxobacteraceae bacterium]